MNDLPCKAPAGTVVLTPHPLWERQATRHSRRAGAFFAPRMARPLSRRPENEGGRRPVSPCPPTDAPPRNRTWNLLIKRHRNNPPRTKNRAVPPLSHPFFGTEPSREGTRLPARPSLPGGAP